jgi:hypothetical protein
MTDLKTLTEAEKKKVEPLQMKVTGKNGEVEFQLYISGEDKVIQHAIKYLQEYLKLIKTKEDLQERK